MTYILAIDQGTTSSRAILFDETMRAHVSGQEEFPQHFPNSGWVEHDPADLWSTVLSTVHEALKKADITAGDIRAIGITNQRETTLVWDRHTGEPVYNAIVWQDRRTADDCARLREDGFEPIVTERTGLLLDPYFSATKLRWILENVDGARVRAEAGDLLFGTVDSFLIWKLTGGKIHATDATNAARTMLYDIAKGRWSTTICSKLGIPLTMLPDVKDCAADFGETDPELFGGAIPIRGVAGDQQAATLGQACFRAGMMKSTYGTGCFALMNTGDVMVRSTHRLLTTIAYQLDGKPTYALEGSIFIAGAVVQWLRDGLGTISQAKEVQAQAEAADPHQNVVLVPAFTGLGAPWWAPECRGAIFGLTRGSGPNELAKAALESVGYQTRDLLEAMTADWEDSQKGTPAAREVLRVDGGMVVSEYAMQFLADIIGAPVDRPEITETTALGAAWLAGMSVGLYPDQEGFAQAWALERQFAPGMAEDTRAEKYERWSRAVKATLQMGG
jgi:glycerol kinase